MDHTLLNRSDAHPQPVGFSRHTFVSDFDLFEIITQVAQCGSVRFRLSLQTLYRGL
jgi:hypothetical protein